MRASEQHDLDRRLAAVERAVTDGDLPVADVADAADLFERVTTLEAELAAARDRIDDLEAASEATRGYLGGVRAVNREIERRADVALATAEGLERRLDGDGVGELLQAGGEVDGSLQPADDDDETIRARDADHEPIHARDADRELIHARDAGDDDEPASLTDRLRDLG